MKIAILCFVFAVSGLEALAQVPPGYVMVPAPQQSMTSAATQIQRSASSGATMNTMMGAMMLGMCMQSKPPNMLLCMMGAMMLVQAMQLNNAANQAQASLAATNPQAQLVPIPISAYPASVTNMPGVASGLTSLNSAGYRVTPGGVLLPNGQLAPASTFGSTSALAAAGFDPRAIQSAQRLADQARERALKQQQDEEREKSRQPAASGN